MHQLEKKWVEKTPCRSQCCHLGTFVLLAALPCLAAAAILSPGCSFRVNGFTFSGEKSRKSESGEITAQITAIEIINRHGRVDVSHRSETKWNWDLTTWAATKEEAESLLDEFTMQVTESDGKQIWELIPPDDTTGCNGFKSDLTIHIPKSVNAIIRNEHGDTDVHDVAGGINIKSAHGDVGCLAVPCAVEIESRHGGVMLDEFANASVNSRHGDLKISKSLGDVSVHSEHGDLSIEDIGGELELESAHGDVKATAIVGNASVENQHGDVMLQCDGESVTCRNSHGNIKITINTTAVQSVEAIGSHSEIDLALPDSARPNISAAARHGDVYNVFDSKIDGSPVVKLETSHHDIRIRKHAVPESKSRSAAKAEHEPG